MRWILFIRYLPAERTCPRGIHTRRYNHNGTGLQQTEPAPEPDIAEKSGLWRTGRRA